MGPPAVTLSGIILQYSAAPYTKKNPAFRFGIVRRYAVVIDTGGLTPSKCRVVGTACQACTQHGTLEGQRWKAR